MKDFYLRGAILCFFIAALLSCQEQDQRLPILGNVDVVDGDTLFHRVPDMLLLDQDSMPFRLSQLDYKVVIADFFFTSCPSICPKVKKQMLRLYDRYKDQPGVYFLSHTIDTKYDTPSVLKRYAHNLEIDTDTWKFLWTEKDSVFALSKDYFVSAMDDPSAPGGFDHSGRIILLDRQRHIRGFCEGTDPTSVDNFFATVDQLLREVEK